MTVCFGPGTKQTVLEQYKLNELSDLTRKNESVIDQATYRIGRDFNLTVTVAHWPILPALLYTEGVKEIILSNDVTIYIKVERLITYNDGICHKFNIKSTKDDYFQLNFNLQLNKSVEAKNLQIVLTSEINTPGIIFYSWYEGKEMIFETKFGTNYEPYINVNLRKIQYLTETSKCSKTTTFYECWASRINLAKFENCARPCIPYQNKNYGKVELPICMTSEEVICVLPVIGTVR